MHWQKYFLIGDIHFLNLITWLSPRQVHVQTYSKIQDLSRSNSSQLERIMFRKLELPFRYPTKSLFITIIFTRAAVSYEIITIIKYWCLKTAIRPILFVKYISVNMWLICNWHINKVFPDLKDILHFLKKNNNNFSHNFLSWNTFV